MGSFFVVFKYGSCCESSVVGAFSTQEKADTYMELLELADKINHRGYGHFVEEIEINDATCILKDVYFLNCKITTGSLCRSLNYRYDGTEKGKQDIIQNVSKWGKVEDIEECVVKEVALKEPS